MIVGFTSENLHAQSEGTIHIVKSFFMVGRKQVSMGGSGVTAYLSEKNEERRILVR